MTHSVRWTKLSFAVKAVFFFSCAEDACRVEGDVGLVNARVCLDVNDNYVCDGDEPFAVSTTDGLYTIDSSRGAASRHSVIAEAKEGVTLSKDNRLSESSYTLVSTAGRGRISIWTTLVATLVEDGVATEPEKARMLLTRAFESAPDYDFDEDLLEPSTTSAQVSFIAEHTFSYLAKKYSQDTETKAAMVKAGVETYTFAQAILDMVDRALLNADQAPPANSEPLQTGVFHGNLDALPISAEMAYGIGLDETNFQLKGQCVNTEIETLPGLCSNSVNYTFELVENVDEVSKHMSIGASAKAGVSVAGFDVVSVSGEFNYLKDTTFKDNSLYILFRDERRLCGYPIAPTLSSTQQDVFVTNFEQFRKTCGDRYLSSIVTGGYFMGIIEIEVDENSSIEEMKLNLSGKVMGITVFNKTWRRRLLDIEQSYVSRTKIVSNLFQYSDNTLSMDEVFLLYDQYTQRMQSPDCYGNGELVSCGYLAAFSPFETLSVVVPYNAERVRTNTEKMHALETYYFETTDILDDVTRILLTPGDYNIGKDVDSFTSPNAWTKERLKSFRVEVENNRRIAVNAWSTCFGNILNCGKNPEELQLPGWLDMKQSLPTRKFVFPEDCDTLCEEFGVLEDGEYSLYFAGDPRNAYTVYCKDMASSSPKTYLILGNTDASWKRPFYNFSSYVNGTQGTVIRTFEALQIVPFYDMIAAAPYLRVVSGQKDFTAVGTTVPFPEGSDDNWIASNLPVLTANAQDFGTAKADLNLEGTAFTLAPSLSIQEGATCNPLSAKIREDGKNIELVATGDPSCTASVANLLLTWEGP